MGALEGKSVFVTGAGSGIGRAAGILFAREGACVAVSDRDPARGVESLQAITSTGGVGMFIPLDVGFPDQVEAAVQRVVTQFGRLDCAFNNAGIGPQSVGSGSMKTGDISEESWNGLLNINLSGVWRCMKAQLKYMTAQKSGSIVNNASIAGLVALSQCASYVASKHAVIGLTKTAAIEYADKNIRINAICPGFTITGINERAVGSKPYDPTPQVPMQRWGSANEIAELALWLLSDRASFVTGAAYAIDGGFTAL